MSLKNKLIISGLILVMIIIGVAWGINLFVKGCNKDRGKVAQAVPIIRFEKFDSAQNRLIIGLLNPGSKPMEIDRTELIYKMNNKIVSTDLVIKEYGNKPLVLDPGDTVLVPLTKRHANDSKKVTGHYWGRLDYRIPGQVDFYRVYHQFRINPS